MSHTRRVVAAAAALALLGAAPSFAAVKAKPKVKPLPASKPLVITDKAGDANFLNSQSHAAPEDPSQSGPFQYDAADLLSASLGRLDNGVKVLGLRATFNLTGAPGQGVIYRIQGSTPACSVFWVSYNFPLGGTPVASLRENCSGANVNTPITTVKVVDKQIVIDLPFTIIPKAVKLGTPISEVFAETKGHASTPAASPTAPTFDDTPTSPAAYKIGS